MAAFQLIQFPFFTMSPKNSQTKISPRTWKVIGSEMDGFRFRVIDTETLHLIAGVGSRDDPNGSDAGNARLIAAAPDLHAMVRSAKNAFRERLTVLRDERRQAVRCSGDVKGIDDQIDNYKVHIAQCDRMLKRVSTRNAPCPSESPPFHFPIERKNPCS